MAEKRKSFKTHKKNIIRTLLFVQSCMNAKSRLVSHTHNQSSVFSLSKRNEKKARTGQVSPQYYYHIQCVFFDACASPTTQPTNKKTERTKRNEKKQTQEA